MNIQVFYAFPCIIEDLNVQQFSSYAVGHFHISVNSTKLDKNSNLRSKVLCHRPCKIDSQTDSNDVTSNTGLPAQNTPIFIRLPLLFAIIIVISVNFSGWKSAYFSTIREQVKILFIELWVNEWIHVRFVLEMYKQKS